MSDEIDRKVIVCGKRTGKIWFEALTSRVFVGRLVQMARNLYPKDDYDVQVFAKPKDWERLLPEEVEFGS